MMLSTLLDKRLIFVTGKGGVGKSTVTAGLAKSLALAGQNTLVLETDTFSAMEDLFSYTSPGLVPVKIGENLFASNLSSEECFVATLGRFVPSDRIARAVIKNRFARIFFKAAPSVNEVSILDQVRVFYEKTKPDGNPFYENIIVDLPASGHAVSFLNVPATMNAMMRGVGPIAKMTAQVAALINDKKVTAIVAVCLPEEMPVNETIELADQLEDVLHRPLTLAIANMVHQDPLAEKDREVFSKIHQRIRETHPGIESLFLAEGGTRDEQTALASLIEGNALAVGWHDRDQSYLQLLHDRLRAPIIEIPIFYEGTGAEIIDRLGDYFHQDSVGAESAAS